MDGSRLCGHNRSLCVCPVAPSFFLVLFLNQLSPDIFSIDSEYRQTRANVRVVSRRDSRYSGCQPVSQVTVYSGAVGKTQITRGNLTKRRRHCKCNDPSLVFPSSFPPVSVHTRFGDRVRRATAFRGTFELSTNSGKLDTQPSSRERRELTIRASTYVCEKHEQPDESRLGPSRAERLRTCSCRA